ncbi:hypothetical protein [Tahibacter harae]|uniref:Uncharacterized protein n=1 Tax=Tahibacter harae TaxID=2963937 RepID=A0ABT1QT71_9GAMM|nr:hypothetical protein [Tahibacter harae]MCQ4165488.1 hypothetical protein [Tahibacter harae]
MSLALALAYADPSARRTAAPTLRAGARCAFRKTLAQCTAPWNWPPMLIPDVFFRLRPDGCGTGRDLHALGARDIPRLPAH